jgi:hypothetical protein
MSYSSDERDAPPTEDLFDDFFSRRDREPDPRERERRTRILTEFVRRTLENAVGQVQQSSTVPREAFTYLLQQGDRGKREVVRIIGSEVSDFLRHIDISTEVLKVLGNLQLDVSASVRFRRTDQGLEPEVASETAVRVGGERVDLDPDLESSLPEEDEG